MTNAPEDNRDRIWSELQRVPEERLRSLIESESSPDLTGWLELALIVRENVGDVRQQLLAIDDWTNAHRSHPAARNLPGDLAFAARTGQPSTAEPGGAGAAVRAAGKGRARHPAAACWPPGTKPGPPDAKRRPSVSSIPP